MVPAELPHTRTRTVQQERLDALSRMARRIAHDFNNAIGPIVGYVDLLVTYPETLDDKEKAITYLNSIGTAARDASVIVGRLREFYRDRDDAAMMALVDLNVVVMEAMSVTAISRKELAQEHDVEVHVKTELAEELTPIQGDEADLRIAVTHLIVNATEAMPQGGTLTIATSQNAGTVTVELRDTGVGMSEEVIEHAFEPFLTTKGGTGKGMGLAIVHGTVQRHAGEVEIDTEVGLGTRVVLRLPVEQDREEEPWAADGRERTADAPDST